MMMQVARLLRHRRLKLSFANLALVQRLMLPSELARRLRNAPNRPELQKLFMTAVVFLYHGRIAAAAQAAREEGLEF